LGQHDLGYRLLFSFPKVVEDLIRSFVPESWVEKLDFSTLQRVNASFVAAELKGREGDLLWKLSLRDGSPIYVYLLIEHQSQVDRFMAVRLMTYIGLLYQALIKEGLLTPDGRLPLVIPIVLYNGEAEWRAPQELADLIERLDEAAEAYVPRLRYRVIDEGRFSLGDLASRHSIAAQIFWLEQNQEPRDVPRGVGRLVPLLEGPHDASLRRAVLSWLDRVLIPRKGTRQRIPQALGLEEFRAMIEKRVEEWNRILREEGRQEGLQEGLQKGLQKGEANFLLGLLERKFGRLDPQTRKRVKSADSERLLDWGLRVLTAERLEDVFN
jgi:predicted transposase/invertase (TIGR01784 family)